MQELRLDCFYSSNQFDNRLDKYTFDIKSYMYEASKSFVSIGFLLHEVDIYNYYTLKGYSSIYEYASSELGFKKSSVNNFLAICRKFCCNEQTGWHISSKYERFNYSQLVELLSMNDKQIAKITPDMSVRQIRKIKKKVCEPIEVECVQTSGLVEEKIEERFVQHKTFFNTCSTCYNIMNNKIFIRDNNGVLFECSDISFCPYCGRYLDELLGVEKNEKNS